MINNNTPHKVADIIRDTWPNIFRPPIDFIPPSKLNDSYELKCNNSLPIKTRSD